MFEVPPLLKNHSNATIGPCDTDAHVHNWAQWAEQLLLAPEVHGSNYCKTSIKSKGLRKTRWNSLLVGQWLWRSW